MYTEILKQLGLSVSESDLYELLVKIGPKTASKLALAAELTRTNTYNIIDSLSSKGLIEMIQRGKKTLFAAAHPNHLLELLKSKQKQLQNIETSLDVAIPSLISDYNLAVGKPGIRYFEGKDGIRETLLNSVHSRVVYGYMDYDSLEKYGLNEIIFEYYEFRKKARTKKLNIILDTPYAREYMKKPRSSPALTDSKVFSGGSRQPFEAQMQIYDGKISYITLSEKNLMGVIIEDPRIYEMHKAIFEFTWKFAKYPEGYQPSVPPLL